uniref:Uncharacterized protein n=1 Tax=Daphnia galeata TaxID=27404 RepID=A0A8J2W4J7_9CRUS|nr:unnamed protein product [Daphnia galeata]
MRFYSTIWFMLLVLSILVVLESVSSYPTSVDDAAEESIVTSRKHSKSNVKEVKTKNKKNGHHHNRHSSRGLKEMTDYDYAAETTGSSISRKPISKDDRSPWSEPKHRRNKKGGGQNRKNNNKQKKRNGTKRQKQLNKRQAAAAAAMRTVRRADAFDNNDDSTAAGQQNLNQLLGLGKPRPLLPPASQLKPFVSVGVFGDMRKFFDELKSNLDVETVAAEAAAAIAEQDSTAPKLSDDDLSQIAGLEDYEELPNYQALRTATGSEKGNSSPVQQQQRRYSRLRGFVAMGGPGQSETSRHHHRSHQYDPALLWTGLGRRR